MPRRRMRRRATREERIARRAARDEARSARDLRAAQNSARYQARERLGQQHHAAQRQREGQRAQLYEALRGEQRGSAKYHGHLAGYRGQESAHKKKVDDWMGRSFGGMRGFDLIDSAGERPEDRYGVGHKLVRLRDNATGDQSAQWVREDRIKDFESKYNTPGGPPKFDFRYFDDRHSAPPGKFEYQPTTEHGPQNLDQIQRGLDWYKQGVDEFTGRSNKATEDIHAAQREFGQKRRSLTGGGPLPGGMGLGASMPSRGSSTSWRRTMHLPKAGPPAPNTGRSLMSRLRGIMGRRR